MRGLKALTAALLLSPLTAMAATLSLPDSAQQGALVFGETEPNAELRLGDQQFQADDQGRFLIGLDRDEPTSVVVERLDASGKVVAKHELGVRARDYDIQRIDGLPPKKVTPPKEVLERIRRENGAIARARAERSDLDAAWEGFDWPAPGRISGVYGSQRVLNGQPRRPHYGIDIAAPIGTPVVAPAAGIVRLAQVDNYYSGNTIILDHGRGLSSAFLHMDIMDVEAGQRVQAGDRLGTIGETGRATGPHLDWRMNWFSRRVDPGLLVDGEPPALED